jgi:Lambda phage tail tube protein, TTP
MKEAISAQNTRMYLENPGATPQATGSITSATRAAPTMLTFSDVTRLANGDPISVLGTGWTSIDGRSWVVQNLNRESKTATLAGTDTSREAEEARPGAFRLNAFADVCAVSYQITENPAADIDTTTLCDDERTTLVGFRDPGSLTFDFFINPSDPDYLALREARDDGDRRMFQIIYRNGVVRTLPIIVQSINESGGVDQAVQGSVTAKITTAPILTQPGSESDEGATYDLIISADPNFGAAPLPVVLTMTEYGNTASQFVIDWGDVSPPQTVTTTVATHTYVDPGEYQTRVTPTIAGHQTAPWAGPLIEVVESVSEPEPDQDENENGVTA